MKHRDILIISPAFAPCTLVGAARMTSLAEYLTSKNYSVTVISFGKWMFEEDLWTRRISENIRVIEIEKTRKVRLELFKRILSEIRQKKYDICISSMGPFYTQMFLWMIGLFLRVPYILDYRDPWFQDEDMHSNLHDYIVRMVEYLNVKYSKAIVCVTPGNANSMKERYRKYSSKIYTIYNGYENLNCFTTNSDGHSGYRICCVGKFLYYNEEAALKLLKSIDQLKEKDIDVKLFHIGENCDDASAILTKYGFANDIYSFLGKKDYHEAMCVLSKMDAAVIIYGLKTGLGTKVFDYIGMNKPIIYVGVMPSELSRFIEQYRNVIVENNQQRLVEKIYDFALKHVTKLDCESRELYMRSTQNEAYRSLIDKCIDRRRV